MLGSRRDANNTQQHKKMHNEKVAPGDQNVCRMKVTEVPFTGKYGTTK